MIEQRNNSSVYMPFQFCFVFTDLSIKAKFKQNASLWFPAYKMSGFAGVYGGGQACLVPQAVKNLPAMWETWVPSLGWGDPQRREQLPAPIFWPGEFHGLYRPWRRKESDMTE